MDRRILVSLAASLAMLPMSAVAQDASASKPGTLLEFKQSEIPMEKGRRPIVFPVPSPSAAAEDAGRVVADLERARRQGDVAHDATGRALRRPDLDYDVANGIEQREISKTLPR